MRHSSTNAMGIRAGGAAGSNGHQNLSHEQLLDCVEVGKALTSELDPEKLLSTIMEKISKLLPSENWSLLMLDEKTKSLYFEIGIDLDLDKVKNFRLPLGRGVAGQAALRECIDAVAKEGGLPKAHERRPRPLPAGARSGHAHQTLRLREREGAPQKRVSRVE